jgi:hypothetical protein
MAKTAKLCRDRRPRLRVGEVGSVFCVGGCHPCGRAPLQASNAAAVPLHKLVRKKTPTQASRID